MTKACKKCHLIIESPEAGAKPSEAHNNAPSICPVCQGTEFTEKFNSIAMVFDAERSEIAGKLGAKAPGRYAIKIKER